MEDYYDINGNPKPTIFRFSTRAEPPEGYAKVELEGVVYKPKICLPRNDEWKTSICVKFSNNDEYEDSSVVFNDRYHYLHPEGEWLATKSYKVTKKGYPITFGISSFGLRHIGEFDITFLFEPAF